MPAYTYEISRADTGARLGEITLAVPVESRDRVRIARRAVPDGVAIPGTAIGIIEGASGMLKAYHRKEEREGSRFRSAFSKAQIKKAWAE